MNEWNTFLKHNKQIMKKIISLEILKPEKVTWVGTMLKKRDENKTSFWLCDIYKIIKM